MEKKRKKIYLIFTLIIIVGVVLFFMLFYFRGSEKDTAQNNVSSEQTPAYLLNEVQCKEKGYSWVSRPGLCAPGEGCGYTCDILTSDVGKTCYSNLECEGACLCSRAIKDSEGYLIGECSKYKFSTEVSDCPCILTTKSKTGFISGCA